jgi:hypothetical protein
MRSYIIKLLARLTVKNQNKWVKDAFAIQAKTLRDLLSQSQKTKFAVQNSFSTIQGYADFKKKVCVNSYEKFSGHIKKVLEGATDELWPGRPKYWAKTSGTTAGSKYIPIAADSLTNHLSTARSVLLNYVYETQNMSFLKGKMLFLSGSPVLNNTTGIPEGRLSGIVNHHVPWYIKKQWLPSLEINSIEDWEQKLNAILDKTLGEKLTLVSGIPPWIQMFFDLVLERTGKNSVIEVFPNLQLIVHGGVNFEPYKQKLFATIGKEIDCIDTYAASEGFIAFQDSQKCNGMLLQLDSGIFYEFIPLVEVDKINPTRLMIDEVQLNVNYALIVTNSAGLWAYMIGDVVKFVSLAPYRIVITGRVQHYISAFGEHVIGEEVDLAMAYALSKHPEVKVKEFTVVPYVSSQSSEKSFHEWIIEFVVVPTNFSSFALDIEKRLRDLNPYYNDLIKDKVLDSLKITILAIGSFEAYMRKHNTLGGQNKVARLSNDRKIADALFACSNSL